MILSDELTSIIRDGELEIDCHQMTIRQQKDHDNLELSGYGKIKLDSRGQLLIEFICLESNQNLNPLSPIPEDSLNPKEKLYLEGRSINGDVFKSDSFLIRPNSNIFTNHPQKYTFPIDKISNSNIIPHRGNTAKSIVLELYDRYDIPKNISNKTESTLGKSSISRNQTKLAIDGFEVNIVHHETHTRLSIHSTEDVTWDTIEQARASSLFYLQFSTGKITLPYVECRYNNSNEETIIYSFDKSLKNERIPPPISSAVSDGTKTLDDHHFELFYCIHRALKNDKHKFNSIQAQWNRVWHSFLSKEFNVPMLTLSISIEGILNDIFIPEIEKKEKDENFEKEKESLLDIINNNEDIKQKHKDTLEKHIGNWGKVHPKKALSYLIEKKIIHNDHLTTWNKLRNSSAHPRLSKPTEERRQKDIYKTIFCLRLFYILTLNAFKYSGHQIIYYKNGESIISTLNHVELDQ